jgi:hypothetical protein
MRDGIAHLRLPPRSRLSKVLRWIDAAGSVGMVGRWDDRRLAAEGSAPRNARMIVDECDHGFDRQSSSTAANTRSPWPDEAPGPAAPGPSTWPTPRSSARRARLRHARSGGEPGAASAQHRTTWGHGGWGPQGLAWLGSGGGGPIPKGVGVGLRRQGTDLLRPGLIPTSGGNRPAATKDATLHRPIPTGVEGGMTVESGGLYPLAWRLVEESG